MFDILHPGMQFGVPCVIGLVVGVVSGAASRRRGVETATALSSRRGQALAWLLVLGGLATVWALYAGRLQDLFPRSWAPFIDLTLHPMATLLASFVFGLILLLEWGAWGDRSRRRTLLSALTVCLGMLAYLGWLSLPVRPGPELAVDTVVFQTTSFSCAAASIATIARMTGAVPDMTEREAAILARTSHGGTLALGELRALRALGFEARFARRLTVDSLVSHGGAGVLHVREPLRGPRRIRHAVALVSVDVEAQTVSVANPLEGMQEYSFEELEEYWIGEAVLVR